MDEPNPTVTEIDDERNATIAAVRRKTLALIASWLKLRGAQDSYAYAVREFRNVMSEDDGGGAYVLSLPIACDGHLISSDGVNLTITRITSI